MRTYSVVIPVFNEAATCSELLEQVASVRIPGVEQEIIIVESNSTDGSREIVTKFAQTHPVKLILQERPQGKGLAVREGLKQATGDIILIQDADLEYSVKDYEKLMNPIWKGRADFVLGSRHLGASTWRVRQFQPEEKRISAAINVGHLLFTWMFNLLYGQKLSDPVTMFKVFRRQCLEGLEFNCNRFDFDFELAGKLILRGYHPVEVPVFYHSRGFKEGKKIRPFRDPFTWVRAIFVTRFSQKKMPRIPPQGQKPTSEPRSP